MDAIDQIRAFNRANLRRIGQVEAAYQALGVTTPEARVLVALDRTDPQTTRGLADGLGLNEGYLSRLISGLVDRGWIARGVSATDGRVRQLTLTELGLAKRDEIETVSRAEVTAWFPSQTLAQRVADLLQAAEGVLTEAETDVPEITLGPLRIGDIGWLTEQHAVHYARSDGFSAEFEILVARILADFAETQDPTRERAWIARRGADRLGSIFIVQGPEPEIAKLRLFFLVPQARGLGLGRRLLEVATGFARQAGYQTLTLWTHESHKAACALYQKAGFRCDSSKPVTSFGVDLVEQQWSLDLRP